MNRAIHYIAFIVCVSASVPGWSQNDPQQTTTIETSAERYIRPAYRLTETPAMVDTVVSIPSKEYPVVPKQIDVKTEVESIAAAKLKIVDPLAKFYRGYVKAGIGMYTSPFLDLHYMETRSRGGSWGVNYRHFSSRNAFNDMPFSGFSDNNAILYGKKFLKNHILSGALKFDYFSRHQYGISPDSLYPRPDTSFTRADVRQRFYNYELNSRLKSYFEDSLKMNHEIYMNYYYYHDYRDKTDSVKFDYAREHGLVIGTELSSYFNKEYINGMLEVDYANYAVDTINPCPYCDTTLRFYNNGNGIVRLGLMINTRGKFWSLKAGGKININLPDRVTSNAGFHFYPDIEARLSLFHNIIIPYAGISGGLERNSFRSITRENPFMLSGLELRNTNNVYKFYGGLRGSLSSKASFNLGVSSGKYRNVPLYWQDTTYSYNNRFSLVYDTMNITAIYGQLSIHKDEELKISGKGEYFMYSGSQLHPWYRPTYKFSLSATYDMADKIIGHVNAYVLGGRKAGSYRAIEGIQPEQGIYVKDLGTFVDINIGGEYRYTKRLSFYINFNNILSKKYQLYQDYPVQGINIHGGVTWSF